MPSFALLNQNTYQPADYDAKSLKIMVSPEGPEILIENKDSFSRFGY